MQLVFYQKKIILFKIILFHKIKKRKKLLKGFSFIKKIIPQESLDYTKNLELIKPDYVVHGDDWKKGIQKNIRTKVIKQLKENKWLCGEYSIADIATWPWIKIYFWAGIDISNLDNLSRWMDQMEKRKACKVGILVPKRESSKNYQLIDLKTSIF